MILTIMFLLLVVGFLLYINRKQKKEIRAWIEISAQQLHEIMDRDRRIRELENPE
jgi:hypothetical protein